MNIAQIIIRPILTEKSVRSEAMNKYSFFVSKDATKVDVKIALATLYGVKPTKVNITKGYAKHKLGKNRKPVQKKAEMRKAIVTLKKGDKLNIGKAKK
ncbi:50S ribosomal protein L23 [Candidatus Peregrinibacteria bacterium]|nr:50S ribosomal protein L23 [Candidatus Peregrinibacteria bacterium]